MPEHDGGILETLDAQEQAEQAEHDRLKVQERERDHIKKWFDNIKRARKHDEDFFKQWAADRKAAKGFEKKYEVWTNLISAIMEVLAAFLYAKNPDLSARPSESVTPDRIQAYREFAKTIQIIASRMLKDAQLKRHAKRWVRGAMTVGIAWIKAAMQTRSEKQPIIQNQINDLQEQIGKIRSKQILLKLGEDDENLLISEIESNIKAAEAKAELVIAEGMVLDYMHPEDVLVAPECGEVENYLNAPWIDFMAYKSKDEVMAITGWSTEKQIEYLNAANRFMQRPRKGETDESGQGYTKIAGEDSESAHGFFLIHEIWSLEDGVVYTLLDGCNDEWARPAYAPITGKRFYPGFQLGFHYLDGERYPQSDVHQLESLQEEYCEIRTDYRIHRRRAKPGTVFNQTGIDPESVKKLVGSHTEEWVGIEPVNQSVDMRTLFERKSYSPVDQGLYDTSVITTDMEKVSGAQDALQSAVQVPKTATEASIQESGRGARTGARLDQLEDVLTELAEYTIQLALLTVDQATAERYAGVGAPWIQLDAQQALSLFDVEIKAGSTGKPKANSDREAWATLMPLVQGLIDKIGAARLKGQEWAAKPWVALLQETFNRLDDHADIQMFLPVVPEEVIKAAAQEGDPPEVKAQIKLDEARSVKELATAVEKVPSLVFSTQMRQLLGMEDEQDATLESLQGALQGTAQPQPPAPEPV